MTDFDEIDDELMGTLERFAQNRGGGYWKADAFDVHVKDIVKQFGSLLWGPPKFVVPIVVGEKADASANQTTIKKVRYGILAIWDDAVVISRWMGMGVTKTNAVAVEDVSATATIAIAEGSASPSITLVDRTREDLTHPIVVGLCPRRLPLGDTADIEVFRDEIVGHISPTSPIFEEVAQEQLFNPVTSPSTSTENHTDDAAPEPTPNHRRKRLIAAGVVASLVGLGVVVATNLQGDDAAVSSPRSGDPGAATDDTGSDRTSVESVAEQLAIEVVSFDLGADQEQLAKRAARIESLTTDLGFSTNFVRDGLDGSGVTVVPTIGSVTVRSLTSSDAVVELRGSVVISLASQSEPVESGFSLRMTLVKVGTDWKVDDVTS